MALAAGGLLAGFGQTGGALTPIAWLGGGGGGSWLGAGRRGRAFGDRVFDGLRGGLRLIVLAAIVWWALAPLGPAVLRMAGAPAASSLAVVALGALRLGAGVAASGVGLAVGDLIVVGLRHRRDLRMTPDELRRDLRESEGDPRFKAERRRLRRAGEIAGGARDVREADFVVWGHRPTGSGALGSVGGGTAPAAAPAALGPVDGDAVAIAVRYLPDVAEAPVVVAKGTGVMAAHVRALAGEGAVPVFEDDALATLLATVGDGAEIPPTGHQAAAELLLRAWRQRGVDGPAGVARGGPPRR